MTTTTNLQVAYTAACDAADIAYDAHRRAYTAARAADIVLENPQAHSPAAVAAALATCRAYADARAAARAAGARVDAARIALRDSLLSRGW
jgi:hypothetical protein